MGNREEYHQHIQVNTYIQKEMRKTYKATTILIYLLAMSPCIHSLYSCHDGLSACVHWTATSNIQNIAYWENWYLWFPFSSTHSALDLSSGISESTEVGDGRKSKSISKIFTCSNEDKSLLPQWQKSNEINLPPSGTRRWFLHIRNSAD